MESLVDIWSMRKRGKRDSARHSKRVKKALKENLKELVSDASIISSDGKKKVKIPIKYLDQYRFKHDPNPNKERTGHSNHSNNPGDIIGHDGTGKGKGGKSGEEEGEDLYEEEVEIAEIIEMMLEDMNLPWLENKDSSVEVETENLKFTDLADIGPLSNVDRKRTIYENLKRNAAKGKVQIKDIRQEDLKYRVWDKQKEYHSNAAVYFLMDRSGSMDDDKKYICKSFFFWLAHFCKTKYNHVEMIFIAHDTKAKIVDESDFFKISNSGGTKCSSAFQLALENIQANHPPKKWNNYVFSFSDGDNWPEDNEKCVKIVDELLELCTAVGYGEINTDSFFGSGQGFFGWSTLHDKFKQSVSHPRFMTAEITQKEDVYACLQDFLGIKDEK